MSAVKDYGIDLSRITLAAFKDQLRAGGLLPSQQILLEDLDARFEVLARMGLGTLEDLVEVLKTKSRVVQFSAESGIDVDYLTVLRRRARGYLPNPVYFRDIPGLDSAVIAALAEGGVKHTRHYFLHGMTPADRSELAARTGLQGTDLVDLAGLTDLARVGYFGPVFIRLVFDVGVHSVRDLIECDPEHLLEQLHQVKTEQGLSTPLPDLKDLTRCIESARMLPLVYEAD